MSDAAADVWTVRRVLEWTIEHLKKSGSETPRLDAEILLSKARGCQRIQLYTDYDAELSPAERTTMRDLVKRRATLEPVAYLVGFREFFGLDFEVTRGVFIPRPDTETLVVEALRILKDRPAPQVLDLCTGSGCIPVSIAVNCPAAQVTTVELDPQVAEVARRNVDRHKVPDRLTILRGDLFEPLRQTGSGAAAGSAARRFDVITSNPPYVCDGEIATLIRDIRDHEPHLALRGGADGLDVVRRLVADGPEFLSPDGFMLLEIAHAQADEVVALFARSGQFHPARMARDLGGRSRVVIAQRRPGNGAPPAPV